MKAFCWRMFCLVTLLFFPIMLLAQAVPDASAESMKLLPALIDAIMGGKWVVVGAIVVMVLTLFVRQFAIPKWNISEDWLPYVSLLIAALYGIGAKVMGGMEAGDAAILVLVSGGLANQLWSAAGKHIFKLILGDKYAETEPGPELPK